MLPTREEALKLIRDGLLFNPGPWGKHCLTAAHCAEKIASACGDMDVEIPAEEVPHVQKEIIKKCNAKYKPVITYWCMTIKC